MVERLGRPLAPAELSDLARRTRVPVAVLRGAISSYADLAEGPADVRVCVGTSCALAGGEALAEALAGRAHVRLAHCLGHCDRSPALLRRDGLVALPGPGAGADRALAAPAAAPPPSVRARCREPIVTRRLGRGGFADLASARADGAYATLEGALSRGPESVLASLEGSGLRGRGGAGFVTGRKWRLAAAAPADDRYVVCNGDEGDPGSFVDRLLMEEDPHGVIEGMALCAYAVGAGQGIAFVRSEYPAALAALARAVDDARAAGILGAAMMGSGPAFDVRVVAGLGSYVCGEETALLEALEGRRCEVRLRPPYPVTAGLHGRPTVVDNVETLVDAVWIVERGADAYAALGTAATPGTKALCLSHGFARPGILEVEMGTPLREVVEEAGGPAGTAPLAAVLAGGPMGSVIPPGEWDVPICYSAMAERGLALGHGGLVALPDDADLPALLRGWLRFMAAESCGRCTPCRLGSRRALELAGGPGLAGARAELERLLEVVETASLCAFGQGIPRPVLRLIELFGDRIAAAEAAP
jgi:NADH:ubiquinone oxidoreductase subunit F (NADH-binding)